MKRRSKWVTRLVIWGWSLGLYAICFACISTWRMDPLTAFFFGSFIGATAAVINQFIRAHVEEGE